MILSLVGIVYWRFCDFAKYYSIGSKIMSLAYEGTSIGIGDI